MQQNNLALSVAVITGGASGLGLDVAKALVKSGRWRVHLLDLNAEAGQQAAQLLGLSARFHQVDLTNYPVLAETMQLIFDERATIDFVFANAGIVESDNFYREHPAGSPPPEFNHLSIRVNLDSVVNTAYLAQHYFRKSPANSGSRNLIMTASVGALYPCLSIPLYTASKHGVVGFTRAIAPMFKKQGVRANALCPGVVATGLMTEDDFNHYPEGHFTPIESVTNTVMKVVNGEDILDATGKHVSGDDVFGLTLEVNVENVYIRSQPDWCDDKMPAIIAATHRELGE